MLHGRILGCLTLFSASIVGACGGQAERGEGERQAGNRDENAAAEVLEPGGVSARPSPSRADVVPPGPAQGGAAADSDNAEGNPIGAGASSIEVCSLQLAEERVAFHQRDAASGVCVDFIMVRVGEGGSTPPGLSLPWDWGVGHMSSYPCTPEGQLAAGASPTPISEATGTVSMGGGLTGLPASVQLSVALHAPATPGAQQGASYAFEAVFDSTSRTCDETTPWALQPLNVQELPSPLSFSACTTIGAYERVILHQRDASTGICARLTLVNDFENGFEADPPFPGVSLPTSWDVDAMFAYACSPEPTPLAPANLTEFTEAAGTISFGGGAGGTPTSVWLDISMSEPAEDPSIAPEQVISAQRFVSEGSIAVSGDCSGAW